MAEMLREGVMLMVLGMGVVFVLLSFLVLAVKGMARLAERIDPPRPAPDVFPVAGTAGGDAELVAAISAAVHAYRKGTKRS